jgi:hypothetical protein
MDSPHSEECLVAGPCEHGNEPSKFIKGREFLGQLSDYRLNMDSAAWSQL